MLVAGGVLLLGGVYARAAPPDPVGVGRRSKRTNGSVDDSAPVVGESTRTYRRRG